MVRSIVPFSLAAALCLFSACNSGNPVAPTDPAPPTPGNLSVTASAAPSTLTAGSSTPSLITVTAKKGDGNPVDDGTEVSLTTSLGSFAASGEAVTTIKQLLNKGSVQVPLYAGSTTGTASILAQVGTTVGRVSVTVAAAPPAVVADFSYAANTLAVTFTDTSTGDPTSWNWDFGDNSKSTERNPVHLYSVGGTYTVTLQATGAGGSSTRTKFVTLSTGTPVAAAFDYEIDPNNTLNVQFFDRSTGDPTSWQWEFGDQTTSSARNPSHTFPAGSTYTVTLTASNAYSSGRVSRFVNTAPSAPTADFDWDATGKTIQFVNKSTNATSLEWDFGDGTKSTETNPSHEYANAGSYPVTLTARNAGGSATAGKIVQTDPIPAANFSFTVNGVTVTFKDLSTNSPTQWRWRFGNGLLGFEQNPTHTYNRENHTYVVTLEATNASGTGTITKEVKTGSVTPP
ncbi:MAG TPA: PKD domain-containing protein [Thermoanaerobaculia bacterium]|nr:PKD domain-containing protein [Thermoanaerobaculia bacterium]